MTPHMMALYPHLSQAINDRIPWNIVGHRVEKIFSYLPLTDSEYRDIRFPIIELGPDLFTSHNPTLHYHSAAAYRSVDRYM